MDNVVERLATITDHLVSFPTVEKNGDDICNCIEWARRRILTHAPRLRIEKFVSQDKPSYLFTAGKAPPRVLFCAHLDVVAAQRHNDFTASKVDSVRMRGRGTADMKGPAAALIDIISEEPVNGMGLLLTTDEEVGGANGTGYVLDTIDWKPEVAILPDGGANMRLITEQKGILRLRLVASGRAAHSSRPWLGDNAIIKMTHAYEALLRAYPPPVSEDDWRVSMVLSEIIGGTSPNTIPGSAEGTLDIRYPSTSLSWQDLYQDVRRRLKRYQVDAFKIAQSDGYQLDGESTYVRRFQQVARDIYHQPLPLDREAGASDARYFGPRDVPVVMFQPECHGWHTEDEWVNLESLSAFRSICAGYARSILGRERGNTRVAATV